MTEREKIVLFGIGVGIGVGIIAIVIAPAWLPVAKARAVQIAAIKGAKFIASSV